MIETTTPTAVSSMRLLDPENKNTLNECHLFAGCGGGILGGILLGHRPVVAVEIEPYCRQVLTQRQTDGLLPSFAIHDDVRTFDGRPWNGIADVVCGGFPCQDISSAGKGAGIEGERSGLWAEMCRIIGEIQPIFAFVENSPMLTLRGLGRVLGDLAGMGYDTRWGVLGAVHAGAPHERNRIWILAYSEEIGIKRGKCNNRGTESQNGIKLQRQPPCSSRETPWKEGEDNAELCRMADGVANRMDRLAALGNGQVPLVAAIAWKTLERGFGV